jgi:glucokinase
MLLSFHKAAQNQASKTETIVLAGDIGFTKTNLALFKTSGDGFTIMHEAHYISHQYNNMMDLSDDFLKGLLPPDSICLGVAGPVLGGHVKLSNLHWDIDREELSNHYKINRINIINDLEANAYGLAMLSDKDIVTIHEGNKTPAGNASVIAPGTGLGEAGIFWDGNAFFPFATEGGHCDFAPRDQFDVELYNYLAKQFGHVSWERLICGPGILNIYKFLRDEKKMDEPNWLREKMENNDTPEVISENVPQSEICKETMQLFIRYLAYESANLVLKMKATGGLFIGGGIAPKNISLFQDNLFYNSYRKSGRLNYLLEGVPIKMIMNPKTALLGAAWYGANF